MELHIFDTVTTDAIRRIRSDASVDGWDGEGSFAVSEVTIGVAEQVINALERLLPTGTEPPEIMAEADGEIGIDGSFGKHRTFWISVNGNGRVSFAGLFGSQGADHGWRLLDLSSPRALDRSLEVIVGHILRLLTAPPGVRVT